MASSEAGFVDFAGSGIVHMCGAAAALAGVILLGPRAGKYNEDGSINAMPGANMPLATWERLSFGLVGSVLMVDQSLNYPT